MAEYYEPDDKPGRSGMPQVVPAVGTPYAYSSSTGPYPPGASDFYPPPAGYPPNPSGYPPNATGYPPNPAYSPQLAANAPGPAGYAPPAPGPPGGYPPSSAGMQAPGAGYGAQSPHHPPPQVLAMQRYQSGMVPPNAIYGAPQGIHLRETFFGDTPAPFECPYCGLSGVTSVRSERSPAAFTACMTVFCMGFCFLLPSCDCLWHKYHYCPNCSQRVGDYCKTDPCLVMDPPNWMRASFGVPA